MGSLNNPGGAGVKFITFDRDITAITGNVSYTGVGFQPSCIIFLATITGNLASIGMSDGTLQRCIKANDSNQALVSITHALNCVSAAVAGQTGVVASMDTDGFTITWTKFGAPGAGTINVMAVCIP